MTTPIPQARRHPAWWLAAALALLYALYFSAYTVQRHDAFLTSAYDLGNFDQAVWNTAHGRPFAMSNLPGVSVRFAHHVEPILLLIAPLYWLWSDARLLLVLQSFALGLSAIPLYDYANRRVGPWAALLIAATYLILPALQGVNLFDFHAVALAPLFLLLAWRFLNERRDLPFALSALLAASTKEEISLLVAMMGLYAIVVQRRRFGWLPFFLGVGWFVVVLEVITPAFNPGGTHEFLNYYAAWGGSAVEFLKAVVTRPFDVVAWIAQPQRAAYVIQLLLPTLGLALLAPQVLMIAAPSLAVNLLSSYAPMTTLVGYHYPAPLLPFVMAAAAAGLANLTSRLSPVARQRANLLAATAMLAVALVLQVGAGATPAAREWRWPRVTEHHDTGSRMVASIPPHASVSAQSQINPHLSQREQIYRYPDGQDRSEYLIFDVTVPDLFFHPNDLKADILSKLDSGAWGVEQARDGWLLLRRCPPSPCESAIPDSFYSFARAERPHPQFGADIRYGDALRLTGYDLLEQGLNTRVRFYWEPLRTITEPVRPFPLFFDPAWTRVLEDTNQRPFLETVWYPPRQWRPGESIQTTTLPFPVGADYNLVMAVLADSSQPGGARLPVTVGVGSAIPEIAKENAPTLLRVRSHRIQPGALRQFTLVPGVTPRAERLGESIRLLGAKMQPDAKAGYTVAASLFWQASAPPRSDYTVFVQLLDGGRVIAQSDQYPTTAFDENVVVRPTTGWALSEIVADSHILSLPPGLPPGDYELVAGMYDLANGARRLPVTGEGGDRLPDDVIPLGVVSVEAP